jgi:ABC-type multidrug transport system fused ATPase/permease subunit
MKLLLRLLTYWRPHWPAVTLAYVTLFTSMGIALANPLVMRYAIDHGLKIEDGVALGSKGALFFSASLLVLNVPNTRRFPVRGSGCREYTRNCPDGSLRTTPARPADTSCAQLCPTAAASCDLVIVERPTMAKSRARA